MVAVASCGSSFEARLVAARLGAEGVLWELRPPIDGPYPVSPVQVLVRAADVDLALAVLAAEPLELDADAEHEGS